MTDLAERPIEQRDGAANRGPEGLVDRLRELHPMLRENAPKGDRDRRTAEETIEALTAAGAFKTAVPRRYGGYQSSMRTMLDVSSTVAEADGGAGWVVALVNVCAWLASLFPEQAQNDVWASNPDAKVSGVLVPSAKSTKVDGGYRVTGKWFWNSGSWWADWAALGIPVTDEHGAVVDQGLVLIPRTDLQIEDTWFTAGMRGSASNALVADDVFVPDHRVLSVPPAISGTYANEHHDEVLYRSAFVPLLSLVLAGPHLGMGRAALEYVREKGRTKSIAYTSYAIQSDSVAFQLQLAEAAMLVDTAHLHAYRAAADIDDAAVRDSYPGVLERARVRADTGWAIQSTTRALDILMSAHGASAFAEFNPLQRIWRDSNTAARHAVTMPILSFEIYGKALLGREDQPTPLI